MSETIAYIALGSNLGDRTAHIASAIGMLAETPGVQRTRVSTIIETMPAHGSAPGQGPYLNGVAEVRTSLSPRELLERCLEIERAHGRDRPNQEHFRGGWGPRTLDLDLLLYGDLVLDEPGLTLPHPRMHERAFVLGPLTEIAPNLVHPVLRKTIQSLLNEL